MQKEIVTYIYHHLERGPANTMVNNPDRYMRTLSQIVESGWFHHVIYCGQMKTTCGGMYKLGNVLYGFILEADRETTMAILDSLDYDYSESFNKVTFEKLDKNLNGFDEWLEKVEKVAEMALK